MAKPFVLAHVSDFHVSTFGDTFHDRARIVKRSARVADTSPSRWEICWEEAGWRVLRERNKKGTALIDPDGYAHPVPSAGKSGLLDPVERAAAKACRLEARRARTLAQAVPRDGALAVLQSSTPKNSNVRFLRAARAVERAEVDAVAMTGDLTDDGDGYELVAAAFGAWRERRTLFAIPGNHDIYLFPLSGSSRPRPSHDSKRAAWQAFARELGLALEPCGAWSRHLMEASVFFVGLDSCSRRQRAFFRQNGAIGPAQLDHLRALAKTPEWQSSRHRVVLVHHHVVPLAHGVGKRAPTELGMRLDDAKELASTLNEVGATLVMHGHRHLSEARHPAGCNFHLLAAPSLTLGCKSGDSASFWRVEFDDRGMHYDRVRIPIEAIEQENDPGTDPPPPAAESSTELETE
jgi:3',5'-cyclic AMP phosphodiesterase CpdA